MAFAIGAIDLKRQGINIGNLHLVHFITAMLHYLGSLVKADNNETVQGLLLVGNFVINEAQRVNAWYVAGQAVRIAIDLGLHRASASSVGVLRSDLESNLI